MTGTTATEEHRFPCSTCGSDLRFEPTRGILQCDHCGAEEPIEGRGPWGGNSIKENDFRKAIEAGVPEAEIEETRVTDCPGCGAKVEISADTHATECPFCATPVVTDTGIHRHIKPRAVGPFDISEDQARAAMNDWLGRLWFAPNGLREYARKGRRMQGIYVPYWTYDADTRTTYKGQRGEHYYETRTRTVVVDGKRTTRREKVQKTRWYPAAGKVARFFDDVLVLASRSLPKSYTDALAPWDLSRLEPYQPQYLAGFRAEAYQVELHEGFTEAREIMNRIITRDVKFDIGGDAQRIAEMDTKIGTLTFKHILLPVWLAAYKYNGKTYRFVVNGQTGKVQGERPWSSWKIAMTVAVGLIVAATVGYFVAQNQ